MIWLVIAMVGVFLVLAWVAGPVLRPPAAAMPLSEEREASARRDQLLAELREAELDLDVGKLGPEDFAAERRRIEAALAREL